MKISKHSRARLARMTKTEQKQVMVAAGLLADNGLITEARYKAISRACKKFVLSTFP